MVLAFVTSLGLMMCVAQAAPVKRKIAQQKVECIPLGAGDEVVTQHGLQFYIDYKTSIRARSMVAKERKPKYQIAYTPEFYHLNANLSDEIHQIEIVSLGSSYGLFEYEEFQNLIKEFPMLADWRNQFQVRPEFVQDY